MKHFLKKNTLPIVTILSLLFVIGGWIYTYYSLIDLDKNDRGTFGDMFGGVNSLFSGLAFCGIIISIMMQSTELQLQREEIKSNREELKGSREAQEQQTKSLERQAENLKISAKLSALNTLANFHMERYKTIEKNNFISKSEAEKELKKANKYIRAIETILNNKN